ncbi:MAG: hypothetical protein QMC38_15605 [Sinobacterium sp.]
MTLKCQFEISLNKCLLLQFSQRCNAALLNGARKAIACRTLGISVRTIQRWYHEKSRQVYEDARPNAFRPVPSNKLSIEERALILETCNLSEFASYPPGYIVPT